MSDSFSPSTDSFTPDPQQIQVQQQSQGFHPADMLMDMYQKSVSPVLNAAKQVYGYPLEKIAQLGRFANQGNQQLADLSAEKLGQAGVNENIAAIPGTILGTASQALMPQNKLQAALMLLGNGPKAIPEAEATAAVRNTPGIVAQTISSRVGRNQLSPNMAQYAIDNPEVLGSGTPSVVQATKEYAEAVPGLKGKVSDLAQKLDKTILRASDYDEAINESGSALKSNKLTPQDALTGLQSINKALRDKQYTAGMDKGQIAEISKVKDGLMDYLQNNGAPKIREAAKTLYEAHIKEAFSSWMPKNKFGSPDSLKAMIGMGQLGTAGSLAVGGLATGHPIAGLATAVPMAANALMSSPKIWGSGLKAAGQMAMSGSDMLGQIAGQSMPFIPNMLMNTNAQNNQ